MQKINKNIDCELTENNIINVCGLTCIFNKKLDNEVKVLDDINLTFEKNKIHCIIGNSGSGKSTFVYHLNGLLKSKHAYLNIDGFKIYGHHFKIKNPKLLRKKASIVFQFPEYQLFKETIIKDAIFGPTALGIPDEKAIEYNKKEILKKISQYSLSFKKILSNLKLSVNDVNVDNFYDHIKLKYKYLKKYDAVFVVLKSKFSKYKTHVKYLYKNSEIIVFENTVKYLKIMGISDDYLHRNPFELSGGQKRRVAIAGILAIEPKILIFDEPTAGLDPKGEQEMMDVILNAKKSGQTVIVITHTIDHVLQIADNVIVLNNGSIFLQGKPYEIFTNKTLLDNTKMELPKVIEFIYNLVEKDKKYQQLFEMQPKTICELAECIKKIKDIKNEL